MKRLSRWMLAVSFLITVCSINVVKAQGSVSLQVFYDELQPYGTWMDHGAYGYVWIPDVDRGFSPYATNGYWVNTTYGNTWVSDYSWGWAPFHYGRWLYDDFYGWMWVPETEWAPAWVAWRSGGGYYGWAPLMPGMNISVAFNYYDRVPHNYWSFVPNRYITYQNVYTHCLPRTQVVTVIHETTIVTHNYNHSRRARFFTGPSRREIERTNREHVKVYAIDTRTRPGRTEIDRESVSFYKPQIDNSRSASTRPARIVREDEYRRTNRAAIESRRESPAVRTEARRTEGVARSQQEAVRREQVERERQRNAAERREPVQATERRNTDNSRERETPRSNEPNVMKRKERSVQIEREHAERTQQWTDQTNRRNEKENSVRANQPRRTEQIQRSQSDQRQRTEIQKREPNVSNQPANNRTGVQRNSAESRDRKTRKPRN